MSSTYKEQIEAIQFAMKNLEAYGFYDSMTEQRLNDAGSTIAALNLVEASDIVSMKEWIELSLKVIMLKAEIKLLIDHVEQNTASYSVLEHARKLIFNQ